MKLEEKLIISTLLLAFLFYQTQLAKAGTGAGTGTGAGAGAREFRLMLFTPNMPGASSDSEVAVRIVGSTGHHDLMFKEEELKAGTCAERAFIPGKTLGAPRHVLIAKRKRKDSARSCWYLHRCVLLSREGKEVERFVFPCERWFSRFEDDRKIRRKLLPEKRLLGYNIDVYTGDEEGAGTSARVRISLKGAKGRALGPQQLDGPGKQFQRGSVNRFGLYGKNLGRIEKIALHQDRRGSGSDWYVEKVIISSNDRRVPRVIFPVKRWLREDENKCIVNGELSTR